MVTHRTPDEHNASRMHPGVEPDRAPNPTGALIWLATKRHLCCWRDAGSVQAEPLTLGDAVRRLAELDHAGGDAPGTPDDTERARLAAHVDAIVRLVEYQPPLWLSRAPKADDAPYARLCGRLGLLACDDPPPSLPDPRRRARRRAPARPTATRPLAIVPPGHDRPAPGDRNALRSQAR